jgi:hypothetical protein
MTRAEKSDVLLANRRKAEGVDRRAEGEAPSASVWRWQDVTRVAHGRTVSAAP